MKKLTLSEVSQKKLSEVHPDLQKVVNRYLEIGDTPITILEGLRDLKTQKEYVRRGVSQTMRSRHLTGHAVDIAPIVDGKATFAWPPYYKLEPQIKKAAKDVGVPLEWGGDWVKFKDGPHWQLPWKKYPANHHSASLLSEETEGQDKFKKSVVIAASGGAFPLSEIAHALSSQQEELASGDITRLVIAGVILALTVAGLVWTWRN
jgi:peptidoglycan L-alanyl-D-glutamate endopeptidase CwlK